MTGDAAPERNPRAILARQAEGRIAALVPLRDERMSQSAFAYYRGTAACMASDLATLPHSGILVPSCGDAHAANFGFYASPQRTLVFDLNDFDESAWAPWEWDVKRLATSFVLAGRHTSRDPAVTERATREATAAYLRALERLVQVAPTIRYFTHYDVGQVLDTLDKSSRKALRQAIADAEKRTGERAARRLTTRDAAGALRFVETPPAMVEVDDATGTAALELTTAYRRSTNIDIAQLLEQYRVADVARRAVGVGSVGTRCYIAALEDGDGHTLILQMKQASSSVLEEYGGIAQPFALLAEIEGLSGPDSGGQGARVVAMQRVLQAASDPFLGHVRGQNGDFYVRQFHDMKGGIDTDVIDDDAFVTYAQACGIVLARAHAQSPAAAEVVGYAGGGKVVTDAITAWADAYADVAIADHAAFVAALAQ